MLTSLKIENVAVIERAEILFDNGLNILTGETGAGKSIVIDSINAILGERTSKDIVRSGCDKARVTALFENIPDSLSAELENYDIDCDDGCILISRIISADGRGSCKINGSPVTVSMLKETGRKLISICGQHDSQFLLQKERHISFIDKYSDSYELLSDYKETYAQLKNANRQLRKLLQNEEDKERKLEFLKYQIDEIANAGIRVGEKEELLKQKKKIDSVEKIMKNLNASSVLISGDGDNPGISSSIYSLIRCLTDVSEYDSRFNDYIASLNDISYVLDECNRTVSSALSESEDGYFDINSIEERLDTIYRLSRKYGSSEEEILEYFDKISQEYESIVMSDELAEKLMAEINELEDELFKRGCYLSDCRKNAAAELEKLIKQELVYLDMPSADFVVDFKDVNALENGMDEVEFLFSANAGQDPKPLHKIASGGELSRVMLAIRCVLTDTDELGTMIFDEIDTGVSGRAAHKIADKMKSLSEKKQIICVTHLAQIAAYADHHFYIEKTTTDGAAYTEISCLSYDGRVSEIARIIGGDVLTESTMKSAVELIDFASQK